MAKTKLSIIFPKKKSTHQEVLSYGRNVESGMSSSEETFPTPKPTIADFKKELDDYQTAIPADVDLSPAIDALLNVRRTKIMGMLTELGEYTLFVAKGNRTIAELSGFELNKANTESKAIKDIVLKSVVGGISPGAIIVRLEDRGNCNFFMAERKFDENDWRIIGGFDTMSHQFTGLPSGNNELRFWGVKGKETTPNKIYITVKVL